jgi:hypothetical protein
MRIRILLLTAALCSFALSAHAKQFGDSGTIEIGGSFSFQNGTTKIEPEQGDAIEYDTQEMRVAPTVGFFFGKKIEGVARLSLVNVSSDASGTKSSGSGAGVDAGFAYLINIGAMRAGPQLLVGYSTSSSKSDLADSEYSEAGPGAEIGAVLKVPFGAGAVLGAGVGFRYDMSTYENDVGGTVSKGEATSTDLAVSASFGVFF